MGSDVRITCYMKLILHGERRENNMLYEVDPPWGETISENNMLHEVDPPWGVT